jgi:hypothetical protein
LARTASAQQRTVKNRSKKYARRQFPCNDITT